MPDNRSPVPQDHYERTIRALLHTTDEIFTHDIGDEVIATRADVERWLADAIADQDLLHWINFTGPYAPEALNA